MSRTSPLPADAIELRIYVIRGQKVMLDRDLAELYGVTTGRLNEQVRRNLERFPGDFMFRLDKRELDDWRSQIAISNPGLRMGARRRPFAFTEHGILMLSSVLRSTRATQVNIAIMRTFVKLRQMLATHKDLAVKLNLLEKKYDGQFRVVFEAIRKLMEPPTPDQTRRQIGFPTENELA